MARRFNVLWPLGQRSFRLGSRTFLAQTTQPASQPASQQLVWFKMKKELGGRKKKKRTDETLMGNPVRTVLLGQREQQQQQWPARRSYVGRGNEETSSERVTRGPSVGCKGEVESAQKRRVRLAKGLVVVVEVVIVCLCVCRVSIVSRPEVLVGGAVATMRRVSAEWSSQRLVSSAR
ncbi:hypothetical protein LY76DRAFT_274946 [Colletotrichum caudatum]|nr:hypothetical protein LY76DRAFT_274946 [Colletotrichum caudatum]